ncbi:B-cell receptor CD22-like [Clarias gariepinus]
MEKEDTQGQIKRPHIPNSKYTEQQGQTGKASKKKVGVKKKCSSKYNHEEEAAEAEEEEDEATNKQSREEEERIGDEEDIVPPSKKKTAAEFRKHLDEQMWKRRKLDQMQRNLQELRNEVLSLKNENTCLKDIIINRGLGKEWSVTYSQEKLCVLTGSTVFMNGSYIHPTGLNVTETFWLINKGEDKQETDLRNEPGYSGRVEYLGDKQKHFSLRLSNVKKTDKNRYYFRIKTNEDKEKHMSEPGVNLTVTDLQVIAPAEVTEGQSAVLTCKTTCSLTDPTFIWYKTSRDLTTNTIKSNEVHLQNVSSEDAGSYSCAVRGYEHLPSPAHTLRVRYHPKNVSVSISPSGEIVEGSSVTLTCSSDVNPPVENYTWFKGTTSVRKGKTYTISNISSEDSGEYKCKCSNKHGHQYSNSVAMTVLYPPKNVSVSISSSGEIVEDSLVTLTCSSDANPPVENYTWFKVNESSAVGSGQSYRALQSGQYYCEAQNKRGSERSAAVSVTLKDPPKNVSVSISPSGEIVEGRSVTLTCSSDANPPVEIYTWFKGTTSVGKVKTYTMSNISSKDSGEYKCKCINKHGHQYSNSVTLTVLYPPKNVSVSTSSSGEIVEGSSVTLTCSSDANPPVEIYTWFKVNESSAVGSGQSYRALQSGQYYCEAQNKHGSERSAAVSVTLKEFQSTVVGIAVGVIVFVFVFLIVAFLFIRKHKRNGSTINQSLQWDNFSSSVALASPNITVSESASTNQNEVLYTNIVHQSAVSPRNTESSSVKSTASKDKEIQYSSIKFTRTGADNRPDNDEEPSVFYSSVK